MLAFSERSIVSKLGYVSHSFGDIISRFLFFRSRLTPFTTNSRKKVSHASYYPVAPGRFWSMPCLISSLVISFSLSLVFRYFFSCSAPAPLRLLLMHFRGFPSMLIRTRSGSSDIRGFKSARSLFDIFSVFSFVSSEMASGKLVSLLLWTSMIVRPGARSKLPNSSIPLYASSNESNDFD